MNGQAVIYSAGGGTAIGNLVNGGVYYVISSGATPNIVQLAETRAKAIAGDCIDLEYTSGWASTMGLTSTGNQTVADLVSEC